MPNSAGPSRRGMTLMASRLTARCWSAPTVMSPGAAAAALQIRKAHCVRCSIGCSARCRCSPDLTNGDRVAKLARFGRRDMHQAGLVGEISLEIDRTGEAVPRLDAEE